jgi:arginine decarboxylase
MEKKHIPEELQNLDKVLVDIYYGNFSLFQSIPDSWAIEQLFPIVPIHRLNEEPKNAAIIADITCDCDGRINRFINLHDVNPSLLLHDIREGEDYLIGVFMVGAYQETLGNLHNLFGDTNVVSVSLDEKEDIAYTRELAGDSVSDVLSYVEY